MDVQYDISVTDKDTFYNIFKKTICQNYWKNYVFFRNLALIEPLLLRYYMLNALLLHIECISIWQCKGRKRLCSGRRQWVELLWLELCCFSHNQGSPCHYKWMWEWGFRDETPYVGQRIWKDGVAIYQDEGDIGRAGLMVKISYLFWLC